MSYATAFVHYCCVWFCLQGTKGKPATLWVYRKTPPMPQTTAPTDEPSMAVSVALHLDHICCRLISFNNQNIPLQGEQGTVIMTASEAVWNLCPALVNARVHFTLPYIQVLALHLKRNRQYTSDFPFSASAHANRRLPKTASTLTMSSDDLDERDMALESGRYHLSVQRRSISVCV